MEVGALKAGHVDLELGLEAPARDSADDLSVNLENWMSQLPEQLRKVPLIHLAIPGSHDSGTYSITAHSEFGPDAEYYLKKVKWLGLPVTYITSRWAKTQGFNTETQLHCGIRFFDLRTASKPNDSLHIVHALYSVPVAEILHEINVFLNNHRNEVVILDFQHFYDMSEKDHSHLIGLVSTVFDTKIVPLQGSYSMNHLTLDYLAENEFQVLIVYRNNRYKHPFFPSGCYPTPWPNTTSSKELVQMLSENLRHRNNAHGYVSQFILSPTGYTIFTHLFGDVKSFSAKTLYTNHMEWVKEQCPGFSGVNVIIGDFIDIFGMEFCKTVINLNRKLLTRAAVKSSMLPQITA